MVATSSYREIKANILRRITSGEWPPGSLLPNEMALAQEYGSARATVSRAMRELVEDGIVERKRKAGSRVRPSPLRQMRLDIPLVRSEIEEQGAEYRYALVRSDILASPDWLRARLNLDPGVEVRHLTCVHFADGHPYQFEDRWINLEANPAARLADFRTSGPNEWLVGQVPFSNVEVSFSATAADG
ncbi:MAG TPA: GntR family transcriptional regulator, partial [Paracoccus sp. (in: a-proteobacteria)]|nr:GntR family transcriptional regulator [Paracoccus sp. (in: a-proteobacteria)]